ncbi:uncharacterized protein FOMMEDRAFT_156697 [Fomitiporia mediterranea MF3/22]|uniref:uncharacterized protein n=1 Tax=Fomitiporia mediterranea (strain MF3/22) TaxID=694068 RepID=UPI0004409643|nr:uncharacterized protein FOMMEDRAFT_156697 [Fomitiporia mediterranea MF3/22]EJD03312.1 hypothetical protein FOMMEDRAFT_156697 [Fomitiporia mediterranea MF3/22]
MSGAPVLCEDLKCHSSIQGAFEANAPHFWHPKSSLETLLYLIFLHLLIQATSSYGTLLNYTIDDTPGDTSNAEGGVVYDSSWASSTDCGHGVSSSSEGKHPACGLLFDRTCASNGTWHAVLGAGSMSILFNGSSLSAYFIAPSVILKHDGSVPTQVGINVSFILDGQYSHDFVHVNQYGTPEYNLVVFTSTSMVAGVRNLTIVSSDSLVSKGVSLRTAAIFDYAVYTNDDGAGMVTEGLRTGMVIFGTMVGLGMCFVVVVLALFLRLRTRQRKALLKVDTWKAPLPSLSVTNVDGGKTEVISQSPHWERFVWQNRGNRTHGTSTSTAHLQDTLHSPRSGSRFPLTQLRRGSASRLEAGVNPIPNTNPPPSVRNSLIKGVDDVLRRNAVESLDEGYFRRRSTLSRLGIPLGGNSGITGTRGTESRPETARIHLAPSSLYLSSQLPGPSISTTVTKRRTTVGHRPDGRATSNSNSSLRVGVGSSCTNTPDTQFQMQHDQALIRRLEAEIQVLRTEREVRLDLARFELGFSGDCGEELPSYDSVA